MRSFGADPADYNTAGIHPALTSFADEVVSTMAPDCLCGDAGAARHLAIALWGHLPDTIAIEPSAKAN
jgi:hypothetical protein